MSDEGSTGSGRDLRHLQNDDAIVNAFSALVSGGKMGYKTVIEKKKDPVYCPKCVKLLSESIKFCPDCGSKAAIKYSSCPQCRKPLDNDQKFCTECGFKIL